MLALGGLTMCDKGLFLRATGTWGRGEFTDQRNSGGGHLGCTLKLFIGRIRFH